MHVNKDVSEWYLKLIDPEFYDGKKKDLNTPYILTSYN